MFGCQNRCWYSRERALERVAPRCRSVSGTFRSACALRPRAQPAARGGNGRRWIPLRSWGAAPDVLGRQQSATRGLQGGGARGDAQGRDSRPIRPQQGTTLLTTTSGRRYANCFQNEFSRQFLMNCYCCQNICQFSDDTRVVVFKKLNILRILKIEVARGLWKKRKGFWNLYGLGDTVSKEPESKDRCQRKNLGTRNAKGAKANDSSDGKIAPAKKTKVAAKKKSQPE